MTVREYSIGELAREFDTTHRTLRFYEAKGLLHPRKTGKNSTTRLFTTRDRHNLMVILEAKRLGYSLDRIRGLAGADGRYSLDNETIALQIEALEHQHQDIAAGLTRLRTLQETTVEARA
jgi:DNA-binding transcriptional MerR regulator